MKRNPILVLGLGVLLSFGVFAVGCGDDAAPKKNDGSADAKKDTGSTGGSTTATGGAKGTGGATGAGGVIGTGGATGVGGATGSGGAIATGGAIGSGGATGSGGAIGQDGGLDVGRDLGQGEAGKLDVTTDQPIKTDVSGEAGTVKIDTNGLDVGVDAPANVDVAIGIDTAPAVDAGSVDGGIDGGLDGGLDI